MAQLTKTKRAIPAHPYRRGETLGKASRAGKPTGRPKTNGKEKARSLPVATNTSASEQAQKSKDHNNEEEGEEEEQVLNNEPRTRPKSGKKGKKFVENQNDLLALAASITGQTEAKNNAKVAKVKQAPKKEKSTRAKPLSAKKKELNVAKELVKARDQEKKASTKAAETALEQALEEPERKRVSFA